MTDPSPTPPIHPPADFRLEPWWSITAPLTNGSGQRSASALDAVIDQFQVESHPRYKPHTDARGNVFTECNIFANDVTRALGCEVAQREWGRRRCASCGAEETGLVELDANRMIQWVAGPRGKINGWTECSQGLARHSADTGHPTLATWENLGGIGHIAPGTPAPAGAPDDGRLWCAQAGAVNFRRGLAVAGFGVRPLRFFIHA